MQIPLQIIFRGIPPSEAVEANIREKAAKLEQFNSHIMSCRVAVEADHQHSHQGNLYHVRIDITTPQKELVVSREHHDKHAHEDVYVAVRDAFRAARRQLEDYSRIIRGEVKTHDLQGNGVVARLIPEEDHGFIEANEDGHELYFHRNSVRGKGFDALEVGSKVRYVEEEADPGPQASSVYP
ncbi:HPF/RaiA family ribosome-associated protein [Methylomarinum sp. Ch1-1]|uniref:HPF/RaiA family ribosome-associated protein n=1 Tax=Methylomarinum roseum TaxID=3067653 RepID=A0AAU7NVD9_9GAMM|nr:HPF/RaiA family ribosome-associated protein [Methylomarinum sp. Ch1-1]MDP4523012.1 HPF/RaiA family ribosome-associated protein [Methylomarinum sp. Ch1-1]